MGQWGLGLSEVPLEEEFIAVECPLSGLKPGLPPWGLHVRFRRVQTLVSEGSPLVKLRNSA